MTTENDRHLHALWQEVDLPERGYELAARRYKDLAQWLRRPESSLAPYDAHVFVQGSFAFGTPIRPVIEGEEYDLDFTCKLRVGISRATHTQQELKRLIGAELTAYRVARGIHKALTEKNRCWRLGYMDELPFHMDVVPGLRADDNVRRALRTAMESVGTQSLLAEEVARRALWITDRQDPGYSQISFEWPSSNPGGYQLWFHARLAGDVSRVLAEAQVDPIPVFRSKAPLQQVVQLLKRHRDLMFKDDTDRKPASILLTTIAGHAYVAGESLSQSMRRVLIALEQVRSSNTDVIANPVNPAENFADRWTRADCLHLHLKANFHRWISQAALDFGRLLDGSDAGKALASAERALGVSLPDAAKRSLGIAAAAPAIVRTVELRGEPTRPWARS